MTISDTNEKAEPPPPLTQREMAQFVTLATLPTLARALDRLRWLEAEVAALKANDPLAEMWRELSEYQEQADRDGHGESWRIMCEERTAHAADGAASAADARAAYAVARATRATRAAWAAQAAVAGASRSARFAADAIAAIRRAKEAKT